MPALGVSIVFFLAALLYGCMLRRAGGRRAVNRSRQGIEPSGAAEEWSDLATIERAWFWLVPSCIAVAVVFGGVALVLGLTLGL